MNEYNWIILLEADNDVEADIILGFLKDNGVPARKADSSPYTGAMRVIGGLAVEVQILVPDSFEQEARSLIGNLEGGSE